MGWRLLEFDWVGPLNVSLELGCVVVAGGCAWLDRGFHYIFEFVLICLVLCWLGCDRVGFAMCRCFPPFGSGV